MALYTLANDILFGSPPATMKAGKLISDQIYNVALLRAAGAQLLSNGNAAVAARATLLQNKDKRGQHGFLMDQGRKVDVISDFTNVGASPHNVVVVLGPSAASTNSPYQVGNYDDIEFQLAGLGAGAAGGTAVLPTPLQVGETHLFRTVGGDPTLHPCTINGTGVNIEDPNNVGQGSYLASVTLRAVSLLLRYDGTNWIYAGS
jgi:hypothetical protein